MENNLPENSIQKLFYDWVTIMQENEKLVAEQFNKFVEQLPEFPVDGQYKWKDVNGNNLID